MCIRDRINAPAPQAVFTLYPAAAIDDTLQESLHQELWTGSVSYTHLRAHETVLDLVCRLLLEKKTTLHIHMHCVCLTLTVLYYSAARYAPYHQYLLGFIT